MAYQAEIEIGVKGAKNLEQALEQITELSKSIDRTNKRTIFGTKQVANLNEYARAVEEARDNLNKTRIQLDGAGNATRTYKKAIDQFVSALGASNQAQKITNDLINQEISARTKATAELKAYNAAAAPPRQAGGSLAGRYLRPGSAVSRTQFGAPIGPEPGVQFGSTTQFGPVGGPSSSVLGGQSSFVAGRVQRLLDVKKDQRTLDQALLDLEKKSAEELSKKVQLQQNLVEGTREVLELAARARRQQEFRAGVSGTAVAGPLAGPGSIGKPGQAFPVALPGLSEAELKGLRTAKQKLEIINRTVQRRKELVGLAANLQRLDGRANVAIADANRDQAKLNDLKQEQLELEEFITREQVKRSISRRKRIIETAKEARRRRKEALGSGIIGGAFPLLFGQGAGASVGGAFGGVAGGLIGGQFGFALSLVGTATGTSADQLREAASSIAAALDGTSASLEAVKEAGISVSDSTINYVKELEDSGRALDAYTAVQSELNSIYGAEGVRVLQELKEANNSANTEAGKLSAVLQTELAPVFILLAQLSGSVARGLRDFIPGLIDLIADVTIGIPGPTTFNKAIKQAPKSDPALVAAGVREREAELAADAEVRSTTAVTEELRRQTQLANLNNDLTNERVVAIKRNSIAIKAGNQIQALRQEILDDIFNTNLKNTNEAKIQQIEQQKILDLAKLDSDVRKAINSEAEKTTRELKKQAAEQRKITDAQISAQLAQDIFAAQPLVDPTPFSRLTPEQKRQSALDLQGIKYAADKRKIENSITNEKIKQSKLDEAEANNNLALLKINNDYTNTIKRRNENYLTQTSQLQTQLNIITATTRQEAERLRLEQEFQALQNSNQFSPEQLQQIKLQKEDILDAQQPLNKFITDSTKALNDLEQVAVDVSQGIGSAVGNALTFGIDALVAGTKSAQEVFADFLRNIAQLLLKTAAQMIATYIAIGVARLFAGVPASGGSSDSFAGVPNSVLNSVIGAKANGGPVKSGNPYIVGERGPELFVPRSNGRVVPNGRFGGGGGGDVNVVVNVDAKGSNAQGSDRDAKALGSAIGIAVRSELVKQKRPGGLLAS